MSAAPVAKKALVPDSDSSSGDVPRKAAAKKRVLTSPIKEPVKKRFVPDSDSDSDVPIKKATPSQARR